MSVDREKPGPKVFTLEEADALLPTVQGVLQSLRSRQYEIRKLEEKKAVEELSWLQEDGTVSPKARDQVSKLEELLRQEKVAFEEALERLSATGAQLKDLDDGLIDFFAEKGGQLVFLCWKEGEDRIRFWHNLGAGFAGRRPIEELA